MKLAIVIGHEKKAQGARGVWPIAQTEYEYNTEISELVFQNAMQRGLEARVFKRDSVGVRGVYKEVNLWANESSVAICCIELHFNAFNGRARGSETLYDEDPGGSKDLAELVHQAICLVFGRRDKTDRGVKRLTREVERGYLNLNLCKIPSVIVEPFFGDNRDDAELAYALKRRYAAALVDSVIKFLNPTQN